MTLDNKTYRNVTITSIIVAILVTCGIGTVYVDDKFLEKNIFGDIFVVYNNN